MAIPRVTDGRLIRYIRTHPQATARDVARQFYTVRSQLAVGARLARLGRGGDLTATFFDNGWHYRVPDPDPPRPPADDHDSLALATLRKAVSRGRLVQTETDLLQLLAVLERLCA